MRIPLDYYRILGVPIQATDAQLSQAYHDRALQLPRREYSDAAIEARKQLLDEAYSVLSDPEQRTVYDTDFLAKTQHNALESVVDTTLNDEQLDRSDRDPNAPTPWLDIEDSQFVGALLLLQELGEYELVLKLGQPFLETHQDSNLGQSDPETAKLARADIILTIALACLELGREQWQQGKSENAALSGQMGQDLLLRAGLFPNIRGEIQADLYKLRPYRVLELLALSESESLQRRKGLQILRDMLGDRGGIDGTGDDQSGLSIDDFLRFIQQLRHYLTVAEQQELFEAEARRPSAVAMYLAVYAAIARGFAHRQPALINRAKDLLKRLSKRQDVYLEQAVCFLLLGQTEAASRALASSQEYEPLAFIREHSQDSPDLLPGLCLYGERWLQSEVFPHFRDLAVLRASLKDYFADENVQAYLEQLPADAMEESQGEWAIVETPAALTAASSTNGHNSDRLTAPATAIAERVTTSNLATLPERRPQTSDQSTATTATKTAKRLTGNGSRTKALALSDGSAGEKSNRSRPGRDRHPLSNGNGAFVRTPPRSKTGRRSPSSKLPRFLLLAGGGILALVLLGLIANWVRSAIFSDPGAVLEEGQLQIQLAQPPLEIPAPDAPIVIPDGPLSEDSARQVILTWLSVKSEALGKDHNLETLDSILAEPLLSLWRNRAQKLKDSNAYREFEHRVKVESVKTSEENPNTAVVEAAVKETAQVYRQGNLNQAASYDDNLRVRYTLNRGGDRWQITKMDVID
ncbi:MAG: IMS domain-containing protein [Jaaginema sp. PMC 1079.18]|nr:IMS domain-containing protein [Jaaginema sp. PMC 1080.18]MEC4849927.1 IMS domain-containing protein [Jaaginema sp. PMC 1079.18]MEC4865176.1 IMS domain-containing protein [Jaaginema sp. PMC 1078.18]